jgi:hypothetical protein
MLGYYVDGGIIGSDYTVCKLVSILELLAECDGHSGDSELVVIDVWYDPATLHWVTDRIALSAHTIYHEKVRAEFTPYVFGANYPDVLGGYPEVWVAIRKHSNYFDDASCDAGSGDPVFAFDECPGNGKLFRPDTGTLRNIGSRGHQFLNCVESDDIFHLDPFPVPPAECLWTYSNFFGWQIDRTTTSTGYGTRLAVWGF